MPKQAARQQAKALHQPPLSKPTKGDPQTHIVDQALTSFSAASDLQSSTAEQHASLIRRLSRPGAKALLQQVARSLQETHGNQYVQRLLSSSAQSTQTAGLTRGPALSLKSIQSPTAPDTTLQRVGTKHPLVPLDEDTSAVPRTMVPLDEISEDDAESDGVSSAAKFVEGATEFLSTYRMVGAAESGGKDLDTLIAELTGKGVSVDEEADEESPITEDESQPLINKKRAEYKKVATALTKHVIKEFMQQHKDDKLGAVHALGLAGFAGYLEKW